MEIKRDQKLGLVVRAPKAPAAQGDGGTEQRGQVVRPPKQVPQGQDSGQQGSGQQGQQGGGGQPQGQGEQK